MSDDFIIPESKYAKFKKQLKTIKQKQIKKRRPVKLGGLKIKLPRAPPII